MRKWKAANCPRVASARTVHSTSWCEVIMEGQITINDWLQSKIKNRAVKDLTSWINTQGQSQYGQVKAIIRKTGVIDSNYHTDVLTNAISAYILKMSLGYMEYLQTEGAEEVKVDFDRFRNYCKHQSGTFKPEGSEEYVKGCTFKNEKNATCWADWQECSRANCPYLKGAI